MHRYSSFTFLAIIVSAGFLFPLIVLGDPPAEDKETEKENGKKTYEKYFSPANRSNVPIHWYGKHLAAMNEPSIAERAEKQEKDSSDEMFRFLWLRTFDHPVAIRLEKTKDKFRLIAKELDGQGGYKPGKIIHDVTRELKKEEWEEINKFLNDCDFWNMPTKESREKVLENGTTERWVMYDGAQWIVEGMKGPKYHLVDRQSPNDDKQRKLGKYRELGLFLIKLSGLDIEENNIY
jgi:hypothetical protein